MTEDLVLYEARPPAVVITLHRPQRLNALSRLLIQAIRAAFERARDDFAARCVILTGAGSAFCAGMDLAELAATLDLEEPGMQKPQATPQVDIWDDAFQLAKLFDLIYTLPKPTVAAINGPAVAGGAGLTTVCDLALAVPQARLGYPEVRRGLVAAMVMPHLLRHVGERTARYLLLTGELMGAEEALRAGLINAVVPADQLMAQAHAWARQLAEGGPLALATTKALLHRFSQQALSVEEGAKASAAPRLTDECREGLRAFFDKRRAPWVAD
ncbi:MAG TPA: enoyl-CoA hydratase-related protein [Gemmataceae bacterium]|nr:enoyl-CoA hydratase-related protein [Gemmataceae bacterium]